MSKHEERPRALEGSCRLLTFSFLPGLQNFWRLPAPLLAAFIGGLQSSLSTPSGIPVEPWMGACASDIRKQILIIQFPFTFLSKRKTSQVSSALIEPLSLRTSYVHVALFPLMPHHQFISSLAELLRAACLSRHLLNRSCVPFLFSSLSHYSPLCHEPPQQPGLSTFPRAARREVRINRVLLVRCLCTGAMYEGAATKAVQL